MNEYVIAKYIRLSQDEAVSESMSIPHQRLLLDSHIEELDLPGAEVLEFVDNGYTGTNIERPGFQEMIEQLRCGKINCIVTKDFSRFARNEIESGYYIEQVFPLYSVRFIAIGDDYDSNNYKDGTGGIDVAFKFLMHEYYSKDLSKKVRTALRVKMRNGENIVGGAVHGYSKNDMGRWEPNPETAEAIRLIFRLALDGLSTSQIRDRLFAAKFPAPREYSLMKQGKDVVPKFMWPTKTVYKILINEQYTGSYVSGKQESTRIGGGSVILNDRADWIIIPDSHPALVSKEDFALVQEMLKKPKELAPVKPVPSSHSNTLRPSIVSGKRKSCAVPYGYVLDDNGDWEISEATAVVVREIYEMALQGLSTMAISDKLYETGHPTPSEQRKINKGYDIQPTNRWMSQAVRDILQDEQYIGTYIAGKSFQIEKSKKYHVPKSEWIRIPGKYPAIISKEVFEQVQDIRADSRKRMERRDYLLFGKTACGCCGFALSYNAHLINKTYRCMKTHANPSAECHKMKVDADTLESAVMNIIRKQAEVVLACDDLSNLQKAKGGEQKAIDFENQAKQLEEQRLQCYEQFLNKEIDRDTFQTLKAGFTSQIDSLTKQLALLKQAERSEDANKKTAGLAGDALSDTATPRDIVNALVKKVLVFPNNHIEIHWNFENFAAGM
jgi:DNA invertase Pin-like site-specific DNA recombinase